jgi:hypothetical protein
VLQGRRRPVHQRPGVLQRQLPERRHLLLRYGTGIPCARLLVPPNMGPCEVARTVCKPPPRWP